MRRMLLPAIAVLCLASAPLAPAQDLPFPPAAASVRVTRDVGFAPAPDGDLQMDVYRPSSGDRAPVLVFFVTARGPSRHQRVYDAWARAAAAHGFAAILPDLRNGEQTADFDHLIAYIAAHATALGADADRIAVFAPSANVAIAFPLVEDPRRQSVRAAAMFYGDATLATFRRDLPVLFVRAGLDRPSTNVDINDLVVLSLRENLPITVVNQSTGHHGFELFDNDAASRQTIEATLDFLRRATTPAYQAALRASLPEATAAAHMESGRFRDAVGAYRALSARAPDDARLALSYNEALLADREYDVACTGFRALKGKDIGARDLGVPAAQACAQAGRAAEAIAWLAGIPARFRPAELAEDPAFASLRDLPEFRALFSGK